jgi:uncharacterized C2H2 Zn-finger protein
MEYLFLILALVLFTALVLIGMWYFKQPPLPALKPSAPVHVPVNPVPGFKHAEAFCLMNYRCQVCNFSEVIWNSRDGVTPFILKCPRCGELRQQHDQWHKDVRFPGYNPKPGQRVFIDLTPEKYSEFIKKRIDSLWESGKYPMKDRFKDKAEAHEKLIQDCKPGSPDVIVYENGMKL